jgi:hypothetical protein
VCLPLGGERDILGPHDGEEEGLVGLLRGLGGRKERGGAGSCSSYFIHLR